MTAFKILDSGNELVQYNYSSYAGFAAKGKLSYCPNYHYPIHWHNEFEFSLVLKGQMDYNIDEKIETIQEGEGIFINSRHMHSNFSPDQTDCEYLCVLAHPTLLSIQPGIEQNYVNPLLHNAELPFLRLSPRTDWQRSILQELSGILEEKSNAAAPLLFQSRFCRIWAVLYNHVDCTDQTATDSADLASVKTMLAFIQENYQCKISLQEIATSGANGKSKCCQPFQRYIGLSPIAYLTQYRLEKSRELLLGGTLSISEIAEIVGFGSASYFAESFRKWYDISPSDYRLKMNDSLFSKNI